MNNQTLTISVAQIPIRFIFKQKSLFYRIKKTYHKFLTNVAADLWLEVEKTHPESLKESFGPGLRSPELFVGSEESAFSGSFEIKKNKGKLLVSSKRSEDFFSNFIRVLYGYLNYQAGGILLHAAVVIKKDKAYIFFGPSGSGKTTLTKLSKNYAVLGDDLAIIKKIKGNYFVFAAPWAISNLKDKPLKPFKVAALFKLFKDKDAYLEKLKSPQSLAEVFTFIVGIEKKPKIYTQLLARYTKLIEKIPCYRLHFRKDNSFWKEIDNVVK